MGEGTFKSYFCGFILSILLTLVAYFFVVHRVLSGWGLIHTVVGVGIAQALIQLLYFLHLGKEPKPRWNLLVFIFMVAIVIILVGGSLWIMYHLNYNMSMH